MERKGIILAGGHGTRLYPMTAVTCKQLLPVYDKPMIYYPLTTLMLGGVRDILVISTPEASPLLEDFMGDGSQFGLSLSYAVQAEPKGIAEAFLIGEEFINGSPVSLILGDNIFHSAGLHNLLQRTLGNVHGATVFATNVPDPERFGVVAFDAHGNVTDIIEKPQNPPSHYAAVGLYHYDSNVVPFTQQLEPSDRGELEITDLNTRYLQEGLLQVEKLGRGTMWLDVGTPQSLLEASNFMAQIDHRQGLKIACPEEIALRMGYVSLKAMQHYIMQGHAKGAYGQYLQEMTEDMQRIMA